MEHPIKGGGGVAILAGLVEYALTWGTSGLLPVGVGVVTYIFLAFLPLPTDQEKRKALPTHFSLGPPSDLTHLCKGLTDLEVTTRTRPYIGREYKVAGRVTNVSELDKILNSMEVTIRVDDPEETAISLWFNTKQWQEQLQSLRKGDRITAVGDIGNISDRMVHLKKCELVGVFPHPHIQNPQEHLAQKESDPKEEKMAFNDSIVAAVWTKGTIIPGYSPNEWRRDANGHAIKRSDYGNRDSDYGWEIDHIMPVAQGGRDDLSNLRPLYWRTNVRRN